jgi:hypothetical protein
MKTMDTIFKGTYGFHPCNKETYYKLKRVRYYAHIDSFQQSALKRWGNKLPKKRVRWKFNPSALAGTNGRWDAVPWEKPEVCPVNLHLLYQEYKKSKSVDKESDVKHLSLSENVIGELIEQAEAWLVRIGKDKR